MESRGFDKHNKWMKTDFITNSRLLCVCAFYLFFFYRCLCADKLRRRQNWARGPLHENARNRIGGHEQNSKCCWVLTANTELITAIKPGLVIHLPLCLSFCEAICWQTLPGTIKPTLERLEVITMAIKAATLHRPKEHDEILTWKCCYGQCRNLVRVIRAVLGPCICYKYVITTARIFRSIYDYIFVYAMDKLSVAAILIGPALGINCIWFIHSLQSWEWAGQSLK